MIARTWKGAVRREDGDEYAEYMRKTGMPGYTQTPGNLATLMLRRDVGDRCEFLMFTLWKSIESVEAFAGEDPEKAIFYPEDDAFLIERDSPPRIGPSRRPSVCTPRSKPRNGAMTDVAGHHPRRHGRTERGTPLAFPAIH
jgi:hypothetical protein